VSDASLARFRVSDVIPAHWRVLGLDPAQASEAAVKAAFRDLARLIHPDTSQVRADAGVLLAQLVRARDHCLRDLVRIGR